jgi:hypothetical protein
VHTVCKYGGVSWGPSGRLAKANGLRVREPMRAVIERVASVLSPRRTMRGAHRQLESLASKESAWHEGGALRYTAFAASRNRLRPSRSGCTKEGVVDASGGNGI